VKIRIAILLLHLNKKLLMEPIGSFFMRKTGRIWLC
jgi:hypothetical protein